MATTLVQLKDGTEVEFNGELTPEQIKVKVAEFKAKRLAPAAVAAPESVAEASQASALSRFGSGLAETLLPSTNPRDYIEGPMYAAQNPLEALKLIGESLYSAHADQAGKTVEAAKQGRYSEMVGHGLATALPAIGPAAAAAGENIGSGDVAKGAGQAAGLLAPFAVRGGKAAAKKLKASSRENALAILRPTSKRAVPQAEAIAGPLAEKKLVALTEEGMMKKLAAKKAEAGPATQTAYQNKPPVNIQPIIADLEALRSKKAVVKGTNVVASKPLNAAIDDISLKLIDMADRFDNVPADVLDDFRDKLNKGLVDATGSYRSEVAPQSLKAIEKGSAQSIKKLLDSKNPDAKVINDTYHIYASAYDFMENARRATVASRAAVTTGSSKGFGALVQRMIPRPVREIPVKIAGAFDSVAWNSVSGATKQALAEAISKAQWDKVRLLLAGAAGTNQATKDKKNGK